MHQHKIVTVEEEFAPLFERAEREGLWFYSRSAIGGWLAPQELRDAQRQGDYLWPAGLFRLRDPRERIEELRADIVIAESRLTSFQRRVAINSPVEGEDETEAGR